MRIPGPGREPFNDGNWPEATTVTVRKLLQHISYYENHTSHGIPPNVYTEGDYPSEILHTAIVCFLILAILGMVGNVIAYFALTKDNKLRYFASTVFINLTSVDLCISCLCSLMVSILFIKSKGHYADDSCKVFAFIQYTGSMTCMLMITAIACNRFVSIVFPQKYSVLFTNKSICLTMTLIWTFPVLLLIAPISEAGGRFAYDIKTGSCDLLDNDPLKSFSLFLIFILCPVVFISCFLIMAIVIISRKNGWECCACCKNPTPSSPENRENLNTAQQDPADDGKEFRPLLFIFIIFTVTVGCYAPIFYVETVRKREDYYAKHVLCNVLFFIASAAKPIMYYAMSENYRAKYKSLFTRNPSLFSTLERNNFSIDNYPQLQNP